MICIAEHAVFEATATRRERFWHKLFLLLTRRRTRRLPPLDPQALSDHLKRDLGFLDGRSRR